MSTGTAECGDTQTVGQARGPRNPTSALREALSLPSWPPRRSLEVWQSAIRSERSCPGWQAVVHLSAVSHAQALHLPVPQQTLQVALLQSGVCSNEAYLSEDKVVT